MTLKSLRLSKYFLPCNSAAIKPSLQRLTKGKRVETKAKRERETERDRWREKTACWRFGRSSSIRLTADVSVCVVTKSRKLHKNFWRQLRHRGSQRQQQQQQQRQAEKAAAGSQSVSSVAAADYAVCEVDGGSWVIRQLRWIRSWHCSSLLQLLLLQLVCSLFFN